jgi:hypothetical protein
MSGTPVKKRLRSITSLLLIVNYKPATMIVLLAPHIQTLLVHINLTNMHLLAKPQRLRILNSEEKSK